MAFQDPSTAVSEAVKHSGGGWGAACVIAGLAIGGLVGLAQRVPPKLVCVEREEFLSPLSACLRYIEQADPVTWIANGAGGIAIGSFVGLIAYKVVQELRRRA
jgi:hypothetical protein